MGTRGVSKKIFRCVAFFPNVASFPCVFHSWMDIYDSEPATWLQGPLPRLVTDVDQLEIVDVIGDEPERALRLNPRWLVFNSKRISRRYSCALLTIENADCYRIAYSIRTKIPIFCCFESYGFLGAGEKRTVRLFVVPSKKWDRDVESTIEQHWKILVQNIRVPENICPESKVAEIELAQRIWRRTRAENPMMYMYTKASVVFDRPPEETNNKGE